MIKKLLLVFLFISSVYADIVNFKENRYLYAIDNSFSKKGTIIFEKESIEVSYNLDSKIMVYSNDKLTIKDGDEVYEVDLEKNIHMKVFFYLLEAIYYNRQDHLKEFFTIKDDNSTILLNPKDLVSNYISHISYKKTKRLDFLEIKLNNKDRIYIEEIN